MRSAVFWLLAFLAGILPAGAEQVDPRAAARRITHLAGDLYRFDDGSAMTVFVVAPEGIVLVDPMNEAAASWLKAELERRFPGRAVEWVVHTHHHYDRAGGASVFDGARAVAHARFNDLLREARQRLPAEFARLDANANNRLESSEIAGDPSAPQVLARDQANDGFIYPDEFYREVDGVALTYESTFDIMLGSRRVRLIHVGPAHSPDMTAVFFPTERVVFVADAIDPAAFSPASVRLRQAITWARTLEGLDFDTLLTDANQTLTKADLQSFRAYLEDLMAGLADSYAAGRSLADIQSGLTLDAHRADPAYARRTTHIAEAYRQLRSFSFEIHGAPAYTSTRAAHSYCSDAYPVCGWATAARATAGGVSVSFDWLTVALEVTVAEQTLASRTSAAYDDAFAHRESEWSILAGYRSRRHGRLSYAAVAGISTTTADMRGLYRVKEMLAPFGGRRPIATQDSRKSLSVGGDAEWWLTNRLAVIVPIRLSWATGDQRLADSQPFASPPLFLINAAAPQTVWPGRMSVWVGVGLRATIFRRIR
jgi:glyoxylase-like metal-dependent hydrolase (beta-lactamase superfamily II)